jgi:hypothetical protein
MIIKKTIQLLSGVETNYSDLKYRNDASLCDLRNKLNESKIFLDYSDFTNDLFLHGIRKFTNINTILLFGKDKDCAYSDFYVPKYKKDYILYGIKTLSLKKSSVIKALYQTLYYRHQKRHIHDFMTYIDSYTDEFEDFVEKNDDDMITLSILIVLKRSLSTNFYMISEEIQKDYMICIPENREEQWIVATLFFNKNSIDFLDKQDLKFYLKKENKDCWNKMNEFLSFVYSVVPVEERHRIIFYSSTILYFLGHRCNNDFDFMIFCKDNDSNFHAPLRAYELERNLPYEESKQKGIYDFSYIHTNDTKLQRAYYEEFYDKWAQKYGVSKFEEIYASGKHHMYFLGMKSTILAQDIIRRQLRNRPRAIADLIALRKRYGIKFDIPQPPKTIDKFHKVDKLSLEEKNAYLQKGGKIITKYGIEEIKVVENIDQNAFLNTIVWALKERYNMEFTLSEVLIELGMEKKSETKNTYQIRIHSKDSLPQPVEKVKEKEKKKVVIVKTKDAITGEVTKSTKIKTVDDTPVKTQKKKQLVFVR